MQKKPISMDVYIFGNKIGYRSGGLSDVIQAETCGKYSGKYIIIIITIINIISI